MKLRALKECPNGRWRTHQADAEALAI